MHTRSIRLLAPAALLALAACGGKDMPIDPEGVARYGAYDYDANAPAAPSGGGGQAIDLSSVNRGAAAPGGAGGGADVASSATPAAGAPQQGGSRAKKGAKYEVITVEKGGTIKITVKLSKAPEAQTVTLNKDQGPGKCGHDTRPVDRVIFDPTTLALANAVVYLIEITKGKDFDGDLAQADREVILDQKECHYVPHVMLVRPGAKVWVKNSDNVQHNAKCFYNTKATLQFNAMSSSNSKLQPSDDTTLAKAGNYILNCDIHLWMTGYIRAVPHPYFAVSGTDGTCTFTNVPPGDYKIACWHEGMLLKVETTGAQITGYRYSEDFELEPQSVTVAPEGTAEVTFTTDPR